MPIVVALFAFGALVWGALWSFHAVSARFGLSVAVGVAVVVAGLIAAGLARAWRRHRDIAPNLPRGADGDWTHEFARGSVSVRLAAGKRLCNVRVDVDEGRYIFADLRGARAVQGGGGWHVVLEVKDARRAEWMLPMHDGREARRWARILLLASEQKL